MSNQNILEHLQEIQGRNLSWLEDWSANVEPRVAEIPIIQALTYEIIQLVNGRYLEMLNNSEQEADE